MQGGNRSEALGWQMSQKRGRQMSAAVWADVWAICVVQMTCCTCFTTIFDVKQVLQGEERYDTLSLRKHKCVEISASVGDLIHHAGTAQFN